MKRLSIKVDERIELVQAEYFHAEELYHLIDDNRDHLREYLAFIDLITEPAIETAFIKKMLNEFAQGTGRLFLIFVNGELSGALDLHAIDQVHKKAEIGYWLRKDFTGQGITTRSVRTLCDFAFYQLGLNKLTIKVDIDNVASNRVAKKAGFEFVGVDKQEVILYDEFRDMNRYSLLKKDFVW
ncbi:GNAT family N-acetyltransferase [Macrococcus equi]|uniref:GNAT family N-acetyltransferase n=1 Tax=Macrococcus equi TaxID=3395462 RepID=UPI0039BE1891